MLNGAIINSALYQAWLLDQQIGFSATLCLMENAEDNPILNPCEFEAQLSRVKKPQRCGDSTLSLLTELSARTDRPEGVVRFSRQCKELGEQLRSAGGINHQALDSRALVVLRDARLGFLDFVRWGTRLAFTAPKGYDWRSQECLWTRQVWDRIRDAAIDSGNAENAASLPQIDFALEQFSNDATEPIPRILALCRWYDLVSKLFGEDELPAILHRLAMALLSTQFCWPLQVVEHQQADADAAPAVTADGSTSFDYVAVSLPFFACLQEPKEHWGIKSMIIFYGNGLGQYLRPDGRLIGHHGFEQATVQWDDAWHEAMKDGLKIGKTLWLSQNGRAVTAQRDRKLAAALNIDFTAAEAIVRPHSDRIVRFTLTDRSATAYWVQVVLSLMLPARRPPLGLATGTVCNIGDGEYRLGSVIGIAEKLRHASRSGFVRKMILPDTKESEEAINELTSNEVDRGDESFRYDLLESLLCTTVRDSADVMQPAGWRRATFIGMPETRWAYGHLTYLQFELDAASIYAPPVDEGPLKEVWDKKQACLTEIAYINAKDDASAIKFMTNEITERQLGFLLANADRNVRLGSGADIHRGPGLGVLCIKTRPGESNMRFWAHIFDALQASKDIWDRFQFGKLDESARALTRLLNNFKADPAISRTPAPDLIVILDEVGMTQSWDPRTRFAGDDRGSLMLLLDPIARVGIAHTPHLASDLEPRDDGRRHFLGCTRILVLAGAKPYPPVYLQQNPTVADSEPDSWLYALGIFRGGFSIHSARAVVTAFLKLRGKPAPTWLAFKDGMDSLKGDHKIHYGRGEYYFSSGSAQLHPECIFNAELHEAAGLSMVPLLAGFATPVSHRRLEMSSGETREASWHFGQMRNFATDAAIDKRARESLAMLGFLAARQDWDTVRALHSDKKTYGVDAYKLALDLLSKEKEKGSTPHASRYAGAIEAGANSFVKDHNKAEISERHTQVNKWVNEALTCCMPAAKIHIQFEWANHLQRLLRQHDLPLDQNKRWHLPNGLGEKVRKTLDTLATDALVPVVRTLFDQEVNSIQRAEFPLRHGWLEVNWNTGKYWTDLQFAYAACATDLSPTVASWLRLLALVCCPQPQWLPDGRGEDHVRKILDLWDCTITDPVAFGYRIRASKLRAENAANPGPLPHLIDARRNVEEWWVSGKIKGAATRQLVGVLGALKIVDVN